MMRKALFLLAALALGACASKEARGPKDAFARLRVVMASGDLRLLYDVIDNESRWAIQTVWKYQREIAKQVEKNFPEGLRERELERLEWARRTSDPREFFAMLFKSGPASLPFVSVNAMGELVRIESEEAARAWVVTTTGLRVPFVRDPDGTWGYAGLFDLLSRRRTDAANDLARITKDIEAAKSGQ